MKALKLLTRRDWICIVIFLLAAFFASDYSAIKGGTCDSSPCSELNQSFTDDRTVDHYFSAMSVPYISPTAGLSYLYFRNNPAFAFGINSKPYSYSLDTKDESYPTPDSWLQNDKRVLIKVFFIHELFVLLSLPIWLGIALLLRLASKRKTPFGRAMQIFFWLVIVSAVVFVMLRYFWNNFDSGEMDDTLRMLL